MGNHVNKLIVQIYKEQKQWQIDKKRQIKTIDANIESN